MKNNPIISEYGPLYGMRVMLSGSALAGPWAARMLGDYGAEVIKIEQPGLGDSSRIVGHRLPSGVVPKWDSLGRNMLGIEFNLNFDLCPDSKDMFVDLCRQCDIWINNIPNIERHGATDELALEANPRLIICHTTGFGLSINGGDPSYLGRTCVDSVSQAFSGMASLNGMPDGPYIAANPILNDVIAAQTSVIGIMVAYYNMLKTGKGQVIDNSMYEASAYSQNYTWASGLNGGGLYKRTGALSNTYYPFGYYPCADNEWVAVGVFGRAIFSRFADVLGFSADEYRYEEIGIVAQQNKEKFNIINRIWLEWLSEHCAEEVETILTENRIPCSRLLNTQTAHYHPHWVNRNNFIKLTDHYSGETIEDFATAPRFCGTPIDYSKYEAAPLLGEHTDIVLRQILNYDDSHIARLKASGAVAASMENK